MLDMFTRQYGDDILTTLRVRYAQILLIFVIIAALIASALSLSGALEISTASLLPLLLLASLVSFVLITRGQFIKIVVHLTLILLLLITFGVDDSNAQVLVLLSTLLLTTISTALLATPFFFILLNAFIILRMAMHVAVVVTQEMNAETLSLQVGTFLVLALIPLIFGLMVRIFVNTLANTATSAQRTARLLQASSDVGQIVSQMLNQEGLLSHAVEIIRDRFGYYHVQVFLIDEDRQYAILRASTGDVGERMLARGHRLPVDAASIIGRVAQAAEPIVARDTRNDPYHSTNELLPNTRSELALPITDGQEVLGALDVQSTQANAFKEEEVQALQLIATQLATAIRNSRLFEAQARSVEENKRLFIESETNLREIQRLNRQLTRQAWSDYLQTERGVRSITLAGRDFVNEDDWTPRMIEARRRRRPISEKMDDKIITAVPIELRGEVVGVVEIESPATQDSDDLREMMQTVSQRLAISIENARLFEETQETTAQEQRVGEIVAQYQSAETVDELLKVTLKGLAETLGAQEGSIRLGDVSSAASPTTDGASSNGHHSKGGSAT